MDLHTRFAVALALVALVFPSTFSAPAVPQTCTPTCRRNSDPKLQYQEGKSYVYSFDTEVVTQVAGATDESSRIKVKGQAVLAAQSSCDFILTLQQVAIQSPSGQAISKIDDIEGSSVRFAYQDGVIESICIAESDSTWSANIKRAVVSLLSNKADKIVGDSETLEVDISGRCPTVYVVDGNKYTKSKDLNSCTNRDGGASVLPGVPYEVSSKVNSAPEIISGLTCEQTVSNGVFQAISCVEDHKFAPIVEESGAIHTVVKSSLNLLSTQDGLQGAKANIPTVPSTIFYDYREIEEVQRQKSSASNAVDLLNKLCLEVSTGTVSSKVPGLFMQLKKAVKYTRKDDLKLMFEKISSGTLCPNGQEKLEKLYLEAAAMAATDGTIAFVAEVISTGKISEETRATFNVYTTFAAHPGVQSLQALDALISRSDAEPEYLLTASGLAHQYCRNTNHKCITNTEYQSLVNKIAQKVHKVEDSDEIETERVIIALQALGNIDQLTPEAVSAVSQLLDDDSVSSRLKIRALDASRRNPCESTLKRKALKKFSNNLITSEVRIQAYLALARCIKQKDIDGIQKVLDVEKSNQVGGFVETHIISVMKSVSPDVKPLKKALKQLKIKNEYQSDVRIYSRHAEFSTFSEPSNIGLSTDGNLIFSQDSYIPRMISGNVTVQAYGRSYNLFELGGYGEGYEQLIESLLGPKGELNNVNFNKIVSDSKNRWATFSTNIRNRVTRDTQIQVSQNEIEAIQSKVHIDPNFHKEPATDLYMRILGTTIMAETVTASQGDKTSLRQRLFRGMEKILEGAKAHKCDLTEPIHFIDEEITVPTIAGLPLNLNIEGTSILSLQMQGNFDLNAIIRGEASDMKAKIMPSAATLLKAKMSVGAGPIESGIQLEGKIHTASGVDIKLAREEGKVEMRFNIPQEKIQLIDIRTDLYWVEQSSDSLEKKTPMKSNVPQKSVADNECTTFLSKSIGLKACADIKIPQSSPNSFFLLNGPSVFSVSIEKVEPSMEGYYLKIANNKDNDNFVVDVVLDTPGSRTNRKITATAKYLNYKSQTPEIKFDLVSPFKTLSIDYLRSNTDALKGASIKIVNDGSEYTGKAEVKKTQISDTTFELEPLVQYSNAGNIVNLLEGKITKISLPIANKLIVDLQTGGSVRSLRTKVSGSVQVEGTGDAVKYTVEKLHLESEALGKVDVDGLVQLDLVKAVDLKLKYGQDAQHQYSVKGKIGEENGKKVIQLKSRSSRRSFLNFELDGECSQKDHTWDHSIKYIRGLEEATKVVIAQTAHVTLDSYKKFDVNQELTIKHPDLNIDISLVTKAKSNPEVERNGIVVLKSGSNFEGEIKYDASGNDLSDYTLKSHAQVSDKLYEFSEVSKKVSEEKRTFVTRLAVSPGFWYEADTELTHRFLKEDIKSELSTKVTSDQLSHPVVFKSGVFAKSGDYGSRLKVDAKGTNYVHLETKFKVSRTQKPTTVEGKAFVKEYVDATLVQSISRPASTLKFSGKWLPTGRVITADSDVTIQGEVHTLNADVKWDAERDASKAASLKSVTTIAGHHWAVDSKNGINIVGTQSQWNLKGKVAKELFNGEHSVEVSVVRSDGKTYSLTVSDVLESNTKVKSSKLNVKVQLPDIPASEITLENRLGSLDTKEAVFEALTNLKVDYKGEKNVNLHAELNSLIPGNYRTLNGQFEASGNVIEQALEGSFKIVAKTGQCEIEASGKRGARQGDIKVKIDLDRFSPKKRLEIEYAVNTPYQTLRSLSGTLKYGVFIESVKNFEITERGSVTVNQGAQYVWEESVTLIDNNFKALYSVSEGGNALIELKATGKRVGKKIQGTASSTVRGKRSEINIEADYELPNADLKIHGKTPLDDLKTFELQITHRSTENGETVNTEVIAKANNEGVHITNKLGLTAQKKNVDLTVAVTKQSPRKLFLELNEASAGNWAVEAKATWGEGGNYLHTIGTLVKSGDAVDANLKVDSPALRANKWSVRVSKKLVAGRQSVALSVEGSDEKIAAISADYAKKEERYGKTYDGSVKIEARAMTLDGNFRVEDTLLDKQRDNGEEGRKISGNVQISGGHPMKLTFLAKRSNMEKRLKASVCNEGDEQCNIGDIQLKHEHKDGDIDYQLRVVSETVTKATKDVNGLVVKTVSAEHGRQFENSVQLILGKERSNPVGYRIYRKDGKEVGAEILLPQRVMAAVLEAGDTGKGDYQVELSFFVDKTRQANRKISLVLNKSSVEKGTRVYVSFHHPDVSKDMKITTTFKGQITNSIEVKTVLDIFEADKEITASYKIQKDNVDHGFQFSTQGSLVSPGQNININTKGQLTRTSSELIYRGEVKYQNRNRQTKSSKIDVSVSRNRIHFEIDGSASKVVSLSASWEKHPTGFEIRQDVQLPGMEDFRTFQTQIVTVNPPRVELKTYTSTSKPGDFYEAFLGFKNTKHFLVGLYDHENGVSNVLADFSVALNTSRILTVKTDWDVVNIRNVVTKAQARGDKTVQRLKSLATESGTEVVEEIKRIVENLKAARVNMKAVCDSYDKQMTDLKTELESDEDTQQLMEYYDFVSELVQEHVRVIKEIITGLRKVLAETIEALKVQAEAIPEVLTKLVEKIPLTLDELQKSADSAVDSFIEASRVVVRLFWDAVDRVSAASPAIAEKLGSLVESSVEIGKVLQKSIVIALEKLTQAWKFVKEASNDLLENETVKDILRQIIARYKDLIAELIEDTKGQAEELRNYILQVLPGKEIQELIESIVEYVEKKARQTPVNDAAAQQEIYNKLVAAVKKVADDIFTIDFKNGLVVAQIPLAKSVENLSDIMRLINEQWNKVHVPKFSKIRVPSYNYGITETINRIKAATRAEAILPPFKAYGLVVGSQYYRTFDGKFYHFEGNCQYLLASDFVDKNFTIVLDYDNTGDKIVKSIIFTNNQDTVAIKPDGSVHVNGQPTTFDDNVEVGRLTVKNVGTKTIIISDDGIATGCDRNVDSCFVSLNGFYQGKIAGLLGTYNNEQFDDFITPESKIENEVERFASEWKVDGSQCTESAIPEHSTQISSAVKTKCAEAFKSRKSSLRPCFGVVETEEYKNICEKLSTEKGYSAQQSVCTAAKAYTHSCYPLAKLELLPECRSL